MRIFLFFLAYLHFFLYLCTLIEDNIVYLTEFSNENIEINTI